MMKVTKHAIYIARVSSHPTSAAWWIGDDGRSREERTLYALSPGIVRFYSSPTGSKPSIDPSPGRRIMHVHDSPAIDRITQIKNIPRVRTTGVVGIHPEPDLCIMSARAIAYQLIGFALHYAERRERLGAAQHRHVCESPQRSNLSCLPVFTARTC